MENAIEHLIYNPKPGDRIRIIIKYENSWVPIFWFKVIKDGSIVLCPRYKNVNSLKIGQGEKVDNGIRFNYSAGTEINDEKIKNDPHLTFHASGEIHSGGQKYYRDPLRGLSNQVEICFVRFEHIDNFNSIEEAEIKKLDACINYPFDKQRPLSARLFASPTQTSKLVVLSDPETNHQVNLTFIYPGIELDGVDSLSIQLVLGHGQKAPWPPLSYVVFKNMREK